MPDSKKRKFSEEEVGRLLQLATQRQEADREATKKREQGLTTEEIEHIAAEVGIDPKYLRYAFSNLDRQEIEEFKSGFWGSPTTIELEKTVPGHLSEEAMLEMLNKIRAYSKHQRGSFEKHLTSFEWANSSAQSSGSLHIQAQPVGDDTKITIKERMDQMMVLMHIWTFFSVFFGFMMTVTGKVPLGLPVAAVISALMFLVGRWGTGAIYKNKKKNLETLLDDLQQIGENDHRANDWSYSEQTDATNASKINLADMDGYAAGDTAARTSKKTKS